jgi:hypothetical protein
MSNEMLVTKANILGGMNAYVLEEIGDEDWFDYWWTYGVPDGATEDDLMEIAKNDELWIECIETFAKICRSVGIIE